MNNETYESKFTSIGKSMEECRADLVGHFFGFNKEVQKIFEIKEEDYETFVVRVGEKGFNFCKTAHQPYDVYVCVACLVLKEYFGDDLCLTSDGIYKDDDDRGVEIDLLLGGKYSINDDWQKPIELYKKFKGIE